MAKIDELQKIDKTLNEYLTLKAEKDRSSFIKSAGSEIVNQLKPTLDAFVRENRATRLEFGNILTAVERLILSVSSMPKWEKSDNTALVEAIKRIEIKAPQVPPVKVNVPPVKIPELKWPDGNMPMEDWVKWTGITLTNPLPVQLRDANGKPVDMGAVTALVSSGGRSGISQKDSNYLKTISESQQNSPMAEMYAYNTSSSTYSYHAIAQPGTSVTAAAWRIRRIESSSDESYITWADGNANFDNVWANRESLTYA